MSNKIAVLIDAELHNEIVLRTRQRRDVTNIIQNVVRDYLERTKHDQDVWSHDYIDELQNIEEEELYVKYGDPAKGYFWQSLFLPNRTKIRMDYKGKYYHAEIAHQRLVYAGQHYTPSEFASVVANHTNRNAWRDVEVCFPGEREFVLADVLRRRPT